MPAKSQAQRGLVFSKRDQYGSKKKTPKKWKWIWGDEWENKGKLPKKVKKKKKVNEAWGEKLDIYLQIVDRWLEGQGFNEYERDAILNDPDNMDIVIEGEKTGINPMELAKELNTNEPVEGYRSTQIAHMTETFVSESVDDFIDPEEDYMDLDDEEPDFISTFGPHDTPVGEEPTTMSIGSPRRFNRKHRPQRSKRRFFRK